MDSQEQGRMESTGIKGLKDTEAEQEQLAICSNEARGTGSFWSHPLRLYTRGACVLKNLPILKCGWIKWHMVYIILSPNIASNWNSWCQNLYESPQFGNSLLWWALAGWVFRAQSRAREGADSWSSRQHVVHIRTRGGVVKWDLGDLYTLFASFWGPSFLSICLCLASVALSVLKC